jgi:nitrite reductase/ring-hydroxylating ferredoxin subunit
MDARTGRRMARKRTWNRHASRKHEWGVRHYVVIAIILVISVVVLIGQLAPVMRWRDVTPSRSGVSGPAIPGPAPVAAPIAARPEQATGQPGLRIPWEDLPEETARFFVVNSTDRGGIRFFLVRQRDGQINAALDVCRTCGGRGIGFIQLGREMACRTCGKRFSIDRFGEGDDECQPIAVPVEREDTEAVILIRDIEWVRDAILPQP